MRIIRRIRAGHYNLVYEVEHDGTAAIAKFIRPKTLLTTNLDVFFGNLLLGDCRGYSTPRSRQEFEKKRLRELRVRGARVPSILDEGDGYFVMEKIPGRNLAEILREGDSREQIRAAFEQLRILHVEFRVYHGSAHPRNVMADGEKAYWIDWETRLTASSLEENQCRDLRVLYRDIARKTPVTDEIRDAVETGYHGALRLCG